MKTVDLIPLILYELNECDKYGFELTKNIENKSNGSILIKQPTLYTLLKKLEKSKFISSYWEDSEIGGKRHYYKITDNGRMQLSTLPSYESLLMSESHDDSHYEESHSNEDLSNLHNTEEEISHIDTEEVNVETTDNTEHISIMDAIMETKTEPIESILPSSEIFTNNIDTVTEVEINTQNSDMLKDEKTSNAESFAHNKDVLKFTEKTPEIREEVKQKIMSTLELEKTIDNDVYPILNKEKKLDSIRYVEYIDIKNDPDHKRAKKTANKIVLKSVLTGIYLIALLVINCIVTNSLGTTPIYYLSLIIGVIAIIFYPITTIGKYNTIRLSLKEKPYKLNLKKRIFITLSTILGIITTLVIINICIDINTIASIFSIKNYANFYAPLILSSSLVADIVIGKIIFKN